MESTASTEQQAEDWAYAEGDVLEDRYEIYERIAQGAFGEVHAARDRREGRDVALKVLRTGSEYRDPKAVARMRQEAEILRALEHPNLVRVHEIAQVDGRECLVMELLEGQSLRELIDAGELATSERARPVVRQILSALMAMHGRGVQHRDLKPDNIILLDTPAASGERTAKLVDFGIAKARDFLDQDHQQTLVQTKDDEFVGTPQYSAPEQAVGDPIDDSSDLFSVGLVVAEWFTGEPRIDASAQRGVVSVLIQPEPLDVSDCPEEWQPWLEKMVAKTPDDRYRSARDALEALPGYDPAAAANAASPGEAPEREERSEERAPETVDLSAAQTEPHEPVDADTAADTEPHEPVGTDGAAETEPHDTVDADTEAETEPYDTVDADAEAETEPHNPVDADAAAETEPQDPVDASVDPEEPTVVQEDGPSATSPTDGADSGGGQRSRSWRGRDDIAPDEETELAPETGEGRGSAKSFWFTAASILLFLLSLGIFIFTFFEVLL